MAPHVDLDGTFFDIGANIGYFSLLLTRKVGWGRNHPDWDAVVAVFSSLQGLGYRFTRVDGSEARIADLDRTTDIICLPDGA